MTTSMMTMLTTGTMMTMTTSMMTILTTGTTTTGMMIWMTDYPEIQYKSYTLLEN